MKEESGVKDLEKQLQKELALIEKGALELIGKDDLKEKLSSYYETKKPLIIKLGLDPSAPDIHLGHTVVLRKIRQFQSLGHKAILIIGDFTGRIGDPTGKNKLRKQLTEKEVLENADTYQTQLLKVLDPEKTIICFNSEWLDKITLKDMIEFMSKQSLFRMLERDGFKKRMESKEAIYLHELLYPMLQGLDSVNIEADVELGGMDQKFNILMGRDMQAKEGLKKQAALFMPIIEGIDGKEKMSKSLNNYIGVSEPAETMFEKVMSIPDILIEKYFTLLTDKPVNEIHDLITGMKEGMLHPKAVKMKLAHEITGLYHSGEDVMKAQEHFVKVIGNGKLPEVLDELTVVENETLLQVIVKAKFASSNSESRRLIMQNGVKINQAVVNDILMNRFNTGDVLQVGKKKFIKLVR